MRNVILAGVLLLAGCIGSATPHNPMKVTSSQKLWWQLDTSEMKPADNPWNKFTPTPKKVEEPKLFPKNWKHKHKNKPTGSIKKINRVY